MKFLGFDRVLCISPHPDDVEYSMMGTILKFLDTKFTVLNLCQGGDMDTTTGKERLAEVHRVWALDIPQWPPNVQLRFTDHVFMRSLREEQWINLIEKEMEDELIDAICLPNECDSHFEHRYVAGFGKALVRSQSTALIQYKTSSTDQHWEPNLFVDIKKEYDFKIQALEEFKSQAHRYYFRPDVLRAFHSDYQSVKKGRHFIEQFKVVDLYA
jgi:LmbE family N-acetylglucosaminyl deacetylase